VGDISQIESCPPFAGSKNEGDFSLRRNTRKKRDQNGSARKDNQQIGQMKKQ
jgi:hypothetical protein